MTGLLFSDRETPPLCETDEFTFQEEVMRVSYLQGKGGASRKKKSIAYWYVV